MIRSLFRFGASAHRQFVPLLATSVLVWGCGGEPKAEPEPTLAPVPPAGVTVAITAIDRGPYNEANRPTVGRQALVEGRVSDPNVTTCVVVHPMTTDTWSVQNLPGPADLGDNGTYQWKTTALFGTPELGLNEDFELVALAESDRRLCINGNTFKTQDFPKALPRSRIITVRRDRN